MSPSSAAAPRVAVLGGGVIGASWSALFLAAGKAVRLYDPDPTTEPRVRATVETVWPVLVSLGLADEGGPRGGLSVCSDPRVAVEGAELVQESVPERLELKHALYAQVEPVLDEATIVASSTSGLTLTELQAGWADPAPFVLGHPFNPPHLVPLVEVMGNERTGSGVVARARTYYESVGKVTIEVRREVPGHVANRLQAALWREAINLVRLGVATVEDVDTAVAAGPGLRWAAMGPTMLFHLGAGDGGIAAFCDRYADSFNRWWDDLGDPRLDAETTRLLVEGMAGSDSPSAIAELAARRDALVAAFVATSGSGRRPDRGSWSPSPRGGTAP